MNKCTKRIGAPNFLSRHDPISIFDGLNVYNIAAEICGVHRTTPLKCVQKIGKAPAEKRKRGRKPLVIDDFDQKALSRLVLSFYTRSPPQLPTLDLITEEAKEIPGFPQVSRSTIRKILMSQGFVYKQRSKKMNVFQREDIVAHRHRYLHAIQKADGAAETHTAEPLIICLSEADFESEDEDDDDHEYLVGYEDEDEEEAVNKIARGHED